MVVLFTANFMGKQQCSFIKVQKHMSCLLFFFFFILAQGVKVRTYSSFCCQAQMNGFKLWKNNGIHICFCTCPGVAFFSCNSDLYLNLLFSFLPRAGATIVPSVEWWQGRMSSLIPALEHTNTWKSSMNVFHTVSTSLLHLFDKIREMSWG